MDRDFSRDRILTLPRIVIFLLNLVRGALQSELDRFFDVLTGVEIATRMVTKAAFSLARRKLHFGAFREVNRVVVDSFYTKQEVQRWRGWRLLAIDGSTAVLPRSAEVISWFGVASEKQQPASALGRVSALYDVLNRMVVDAHLAPYRVGEREMALMHLGCVGSNDLVLLDRGYPAFWLLSVLSSLGVQFCMRICSSHSSELREFAKSGVRERIVKMAVRGDARTDCRARGISTESVKVRLVRVELGNGEVEMLITSLLDLQNYPHDIFADLYHQRWGIEESYKFLKCRLEIENFSGKSVHAVMQEFHAKIVTGNLTALGAHQAQTLVDQSGTRGQRVRVNFSHALARMKNTIVRCLTATNPIAILGRYLDILRRTVEMVRPGRKALRRIIKHRPVRFPTSYKRST